MNLSSLSSLLTEKPYCRQLVTDINNGGHLRKTMVVPDAVKPYVLASFRQGLSVPLLVITAHPDAARQLYDEIHEWISDDDTVLFFPEAGFLPENYIAPDTVVLNERAKTLFSLAHSGNSCDHNGHKSVMVITHASAAAGYIMSPGNFVKSNIALSSGMMVDPLDLISKCQSIGYAMDTIVEIPGSMSRRGGILDIFSRNYEMPVRVEFYGNQIDSIRFYDPKTQRSIATVSSIDIVPSDEDNMSSDQGTIFDYMPRDTCLVLDDREGIENAVQRINEQWYEFLQSDGGENPEKNRCPAYLTMDIFFRNIEKFDRRLTLVPWFTDVLNTSDVLVWPFASLQNYGGRYDSFIEDIVHMPAAYNRVLIISQQPERLNELLLEHDVIASFVEKIDSVPAERSLLLMRGSLSEGWLLKDTLAVFTDREIFGVIKQRRLSRKRPIRHHTFTSQFTEGDYVVHVDHGIARFSGIVKRTLNGSEKEYLTLQYEGDDILFVPVDQVDRISRYIGSSDHPPVLSHFGTQEWMKIKARVGRSVIDMAKKLLDLYAARETADGYSFSGDSLWQQELEMAFSYTETPDQLSAIDAVKRDMESSRPMDRLVCGDVGYGKTEVALRAAFKAVMDNKQVAVLVPTTILAQQHYTTFTERLKAFPARIKVLSRFCSPVEEKQIVRELSEGQVDICIGTHRLLQKDIHFKSLGLVVVDEEQRFGVVHKEHLKDLSRGVDVLTLSATPIPRTLHMSLIGIRDMSTIETPPEERLPITTYVGRYDERIIREAILRELERKGQVFFVHNRVFDIEGIARNINTLVPEARVLYAHGQMSEDDLEHVMSVFAAKRADVLVTTTIIESGLDLPNVNTLIVDRADKFGLTQLYQLRGRIGRGSNIAYAYFFYNRNELMNPRARKRLATIAEATELGAGFAVAMRDLEIRGAGNLLGAEQSGHIAAVGYDLYCQLLAEAVKQMKEGAYTPVNLMHPTPAPSIVLPLDAFIPDDYVPAINERLSYYQRLVTVQTIKNIGDIEQEFIDRYGQMPSPVQDLLYAVRVKLLAADASVNLISSNADEIIIAFNTAVDVKSLVLIKKYRKIVTIGHKQIRIQSNTDEWRSALLHVLEAMGAMYGDAGLSMNCHR